MFRSINFLLSISLGLICLVCCSQNNPKLPVQDSVKFEIQSLPGDSLFVVKQTTWRRDGSKTTAESRPYNLTEMKQFYLMAISANRKQLIDSEEELAGIERRQAIMRDQIQDFLKAYESIRAPADPEVKPHPIDQKTNKR